MHGCSSCRRGRCSSDLPRQEPASRCAGAHPWCGPDKVRGLPNGIDPTSPSPPMSNTRFWRDALTSGSAASLLSLLALMLEGRRENASAAAPINAVSHWLHGPRAYTVNRTTWAHTAVGASVHCVSAIFWGGLYGLLLRRIAARREEALHRRRPRAGAPAPEVTVPEAVASAAVVTGRGADRPAPGSAAPDARLREPAQRDCGRGGLSGVRRGAGARRHRDRAIDGVGHSTLKSQKSSNVSNSETTTEPRQPSRFEKNRNLDQASAVSGSAAC